MDITTALVGLGCFLVSAAVLYFISVFGTKEKTYEEAIEEQRRQAERAFSTTRTEKTVKDKKFKKFGRKSKEKLDKFGGDGDDIILGESHEEDDDQSHLEIVETPLLKEDKKKSKEKIRKSESETKATVVVKRDKSSPQLGGHNHTTVAQIHAVDSSSKVETSKSNTQVKPQAATVKQELPKQKEEANKSAAQEQVKRVESNSTSNTKEESVASPVKRAKKSRSEISIALESQPNMLQFMEHIKEALLSHNEIQALIDILLNKQQNGSSEWLQKGQKQDTLPQLKKQVTELEQQLADERTLNQNTAGKLREIRTELNQEKTRSGQIEKNLRDKAYKQDQDIQALQTRVKTMRDQHSSETSELKAKIEQVSSSSNDSNLQVIQNLQDENARLHQAYAQAEKHSFEATEVPRLQFEIEQLRRVKDQYEVRQAGMQQNQLELQARIQQLEQHILALESSKDLEIRENMTNLQQQIQSVGAQLNDAVQIKLTLESQTHNLQVEISDLRAQLSSAEQSSHEVSTLKQTVTDLESNQQSFNTAKSHMESEVKKLLSDLQNVRSQLQERDIQIKVLAEEKIIFVGEIGELKSTIENQTSKQNEDAKDQFSMKDHEFIIAEKNQALADLTDQLNASKTSSDKLNKQLDETNFLLQQIQTNYNQQTTTVENLGLEINQRSSESSKLKAELENLKEKNNDLQQKNWNTMQAVKATEKLAEEKAHLAEKSILDARSKSKTEEESAHKAFLKRIFPLVQVKSDLPYSSFLAEYEKQVVQFTQEYNQASAFTSELASLMKESEETRQGLEAQIEHYKTVMTETESILNKLQTSVEEEEDNWKSKLKAKEEELDQIKEELRLTACEKGALEESLDQIKEMQEKLRELQVKLEGEENEKRVLESKYIQTQESSSMVTRELEQNQKQLEAATARAEQLQKEIENVRGDIENEKTTSKETHLQNVKLSSLVKIGEDALKAEQEQVKELQNKLDALQSATNATSNGPPKEPNALQQGEVSSESH